MRTSESVAKIFPALIDAQAEFADLKKDTTNPFFKSQYVELSQVLSSIRPVMHKQGLAVLQFPGHIADSKLAITTRVIHTSGEWIEDEAHVPLQKNDPQGFGSTLTYAKRYSLIAALGLVADEDDDGNKGTAPVKETPKEPMKASVSQPVAPPKDKKNITAEIIKATYNAPKARSEYEVETPDHEHFTVLIKKPIQAFEQRQKVEVVGMWESEFKGKIYHMADNIKPFVTMASEEEIPF